MAALFAEGRHPNADQITADLTRAQASQKDAVAATELGKPFPRPEDTPAFKVAVARRAAEVNVANGASRDTVLAAAERARIRTEVGREMFAEAYGRNPKDPRELSSFIARNSRSTTQRDRRVRPDVHPGQVGVGAVGDRPTARRRRDHRRAPRRRRRRPGLAGAGSQLHPRRAAPGCGSWTPPACSPRRSTTATPAPATPTCTPTSRSPPRSRPGRGRHPGRWLALDARVLFKATVTASERYNTRIEAELHRRLGVTFQPRSDADAAAAAGKRTIREIAGVPEELSEIWSKRRARIDVRRAALAVAFQAEHGRPPTPVEALKLAQQATLETRDAKHEPRSEAQQRATWRAEAAHLLGSPDRVDTLVRDVVPAASMRRKARDRPPSHCCAVTGPSRPGRRADHPGPGGGRGRPVDVAGVARPLRGGTAGARQRTRWCPRWGRRRAGRPDRAPGAAPVPVHPADPTRPGAHGPRLTGPAAPPGRLQRVRRRRLPAVHLSHRPGRRGVPGRGRTPPRRTSRHRPRRRHGPAGVGRQRPQPQHRPGAPGPADGHLRRPRPAGHRPGRIRQDHRDVRADRRLDRRRWNRPRPGALRRGR